MRIISSRFWVLPSSRQVAQLKIPLFVYTLLIFSKWTSEGCCSVCLSLRERIFLAEKLYYLVETLPFSMNILFISPLVGWFLSSLILHHMTTLVLAAFTDSDSNWKILAYYVISRSKKTKLVSFSISTSIDLLGTRHCSTKLFELVLTFLLMSAA